MYNTVQLYILSVQVMLCAAVLLPVLNNAKERVANALMSIKGLQSVVPILVLAYGAIFAMGCLNCLRQHGALAPGSTADTAARLSAVVAMFDSIVTGMNLGMILVLARTYNMVVENNRLKRDLANLQRQAKSMSDFMYSQQPGETKTGTTAAAATASSSAATTGKSKSLASPRVEKEQEEQEEPAEPVSSVVEGEEADGLAGGGPRGTSSGATSPRQRRRRRAE